MISDCAAVLCQTNTVAGACWIIGLGFHDYLRYDPGFIRIIRM